MHLKQLIRDVHATAVEKGWWEIERSWREVRMLVVTEIAEAMEEYRAGRLVTRTDSGLMGPNYPGKPEGLPIELADVAIRLMDYAAYKGYSDDWDEDDCRLVLAGGVDGIKGSIPEQLDRLTEYLYSDEMGDEGRVWQALGSVFEVAERNDIDLLDAIQLKAAYNKTRAYRHGGKAA